eukprot:gnl/TRDRNA2_/TRDRNA2_39432_c0_seq1.p1 gnl/TRDRNA2_/TRDRNA2_39432_c0~~gnl/TRDRNA2_/TRDRNA2_39432_c0_seq1.p1  ORF type:complete len:296 (+),score=51.61 gnl/TRDRNA2_/TRDRNA2_39432_c0_seq1:50-937(+)
MHVGYPSVFLGGRSEEQRFNLAEISMTVGFKLDSPNKGEATLTKIDAFASADVATMVRARRREGNICFSTGQLEEARGHYSEAIHLDPNSSVLRSLHSTVLFALGRYSEALADAEQCLELEPESWKGHACRGQALFKLGRFEDSEKSFTDALRLNSQEKDIIEGLERASRARLDGFVEGQGLREMAACAVAARETQPPAVDGGLMPSCPMLPGEVDEAGELTEQRSDSNHSMNDMVKKEAKKALAEARAEAKMVQAEAKKDMQITKDMAFSVGEKLLERRKRWLEEWSSWTPIAS